MKRLASFLLVLMMTVSLAACGENGLSLRPGGPNGGSADAYKEGGAKGYIGDVLHTYWFDFVVNSAKLCQEYEGCTAYDGYRLLVLDMSIKNTVDFSIPMYWSDFPITWGDGDEDYAYPLAKDEFNATRNIFPDEYTLGINENKSGVMVYEVPATDVPDYILLYWELFEDGTEEGTEGDTYAVYFTAEQQ